MSIVGFDLKKAFDTVPHSILFSKLQTVLPERLLKLVSSFLSQRYQRTKINGIFSPVLPVSSGVPQGGNLSPLLFFFINDLMQCPNTEIIKFADDTTFLVKHHKDEKVDYVNTVVNHMKNWCNKNLSLIHI